MHTRTAARVAPLLAALCLLLVSSSAAARVAPRVEAEAPRRIMPRPSGPVFVTSDLHENRYEGMPLDTAQVVAFYDGESSARPTLTLQCRDAAGRLDSLRLTELPRSSHMSPGHIQTAEFRMFGCVPTGVVQVSGVVADGAIDGVAFGVLYRDSAGRFHQLRSQSPDGARAEAVGMWPLQMSDAQFASQTPQITSGIARAQAMTVLFGAEYLSNGEHRLSLPASFAHVNRPLPARPMSRCCRVPAM